MTKHPLTLVRHARAPQWSPAEIAAGLDRPRFQPAKGSNPLPALERLPGWWQGAMGVRLQFMREDAARVDRLRAIAAEGAEPEEGETPCVHRRRDVALAVQAGVALLLRWHAEHARAVERYSRRMAGVFARLPE